MRENPSFELIRNPKLYVFVPFVLLNRSDIHSSQPLLLLDKNDTNLAFMAPGPQNSSSQDVSWDEAISQLGNFIEEVRNTEPVSWLSKEVDHRRGKYASVSGGITHGNGRKVSIVACTKYLGLRCSLASP